MNATRIALIGVGIVALGAAGYFGNSVLSCQALEEDYLNSVDTLRGSIALNAVISDPELQAMTAKRDEVAQRAGRRALEQLYQECGDRAGQNAVRKGQDMILGL